MKVFLSVYKSGNCIADQVESGNTFFKRFKGLMGRKSLRENQGFYLNPCRSIHTFQMRFPIDVLFLSEGGIVVDIVKEMKPWRLKTSVKEAQSTLELPPKAADRLGIVIGDKLVFKKTGNGEG